MFITELDLYKKRVIVRIDANVPLDAGIIDDYKLQGLIPTCDYLRAQEAQVVLITHLGRPHGHDQHYSTRQLIPWFEKRGYPVSFSDTLNTTGPWTLLENIRFYPEEQEGSTTFAQQLAQLGDYYISDAFGVLHRHDTSVSLLPHLFAEHKRGYGFLIKQELEALARLIKPEHPFVCIIGGGKVRDKLPVLEHLMNHADTLLLLPALSCTFSKALGMSVGTSLVDNTLLQSASTYLEHAHTKGVTVKLPSDYIVAQGSFYGPLRESINMNEQDMAISIGPRTIAEWKETIISARTIFINGVPGDVKRKETLTGFKQLLETCALSPGYSIVGGGDSTAAVRVLGLEHAVQYLSTGGGATLEYITDQKLPGLQALGL